MDRPLVTIPRTIWREVEHNWTLDWRGQTAGVTLAGQTKVVFNAFPRWRGAPKVFLHQDDFLSWRAVMLKAQGHVGIYRVPMNDPLSFQRETATVPLNTGQTLNTGLFVESTETVLATWAVPLGNDSITIDVPEGGIIPRPGQLMSHGEDWPFGVTAVERNTTGPNRYRLDVQPPTRSVIAQGEEVRHSAYGRFEIQDRDVGFPVYGADRATQFSIPLQEVLTRG